MSEDQLPYQPSYFERMRLIRLGLLPKEAVAKPKKPLNKISPKKALENKIIKEQQGDSPLDRWFEERRLEMTGRCSLCSEYSSKKNDERYRWSCHHLLDKRKTMFPSLALHPMNFLEVCHDCHQNIHNGLITWQILFDSKERDLILPKLLILLPLCTPEEKKRKVYSLLTELVFNTK